MRTVKTIRLFYLLYTAYTILVLWVSNYKITTAVSGLVFLWVAYGLFKFGFRSKKVNIGTKTGDYEPVSHEFPLASIEEWKPIRKLLMTIAVWISTILCARFYTGRGFSSVISGVFGGASAYMNYQRYFASSNIGTLSLTKIPYILMLAFLTISTIWMVLSTVLCKRRRKWWDYLFLIGTVLAYLYFGVARGTNFETYIVFIIFSFCFLQKANGLDRKRKILYLTVVIVIGVLMVMVYRFVLQDRGIEFRNIICPEIQYDQNALLSKTFPTFVNIAISLFSYLGYGIYAIGVCVNDVIFSSGGSMIGALLPNGYSLITGASLQTALAQTINMGVRWIPDYIQLINILGIPLSFLFLILLGRFTAKIYYGTYPQLLKEVLHAIIYIEMLSLPVGNFLLSSSSNELMLLFAIAWLIQDKHIAIRIRSQSSGNKRGI